MEIFFTSDNHFGHINIIRYCNRPFRDAEEMNETMIANWNSLVSEEDVVFNLGDFFFSEKLISSILPKLNGKIVWILGNHDRRSVATRAMYNYPNKIGCLVSGNFLLKAKIDENQMPYLEAPIENSPRFWCPWEVVWGGGILMSHKEVHDNENVGIRLFGHDHRPIAKVENKGLNVGVDAHNFEPISLSKLMKIFYGRPFYA